MGKDARPQAPGEIDQRPEIAAQKDHQPRLDNLLMEEREEQRRRRQRDDRPEARQQSPEENPAKERLLAERRDEDEQRQRRESPLLLGLFDALPDVLLFLSGLALIAEATNHLGLDVGEAVEQPERRERCDDIDDKKRTGTARVR